MSYLELRDIHKSYHLGKEKFPVLKGIDLSFDLGEFVSILGESGGGKSTLMNIIGGLDQQFQGSVAIDGKRLNHINERALDHYRRDTIGYIYQDYNLISHLTVMDNVLIPLDMTTLSKSEQKKRAAELLDRVGLKNQAHKYPNQLSGGQKQRVAIARALASDPKVIIADEPTGALDSENTKEVLKILDDIAQEGRLVITVTHSQVVANAGTRIVHLANGKIDKDIKLRDSYQVTHMPRLKSRLLPASVSYITAFKHFKFNFWRNSLIVLGTAVGLFAVILFSGLGNGISGYINKQITDLVNPTAVSISRYQKSSTSSKQAQQRQAMQQQASVSGNSSSITANSSKSTFSKKQLDQLSKVKHVKGVSKVYTAKNVTSRYRNKSATISTIENWNDSATSYIIKYGSKPKLGEVVIDKDNVAKKLSKTHWKNLIGKSITLSYKMTNKNNKQVTIKLTAKVSGISQTSNSGGMVSDNYINTKTLTNAMNEANVDTKITDSVVKVDKINNVNGVTSKINKLKLNNKRQYSATSVNSIITTIQTYVKLATNILSAIAAISLIVSALMIIVTMYMSVSARTKEIGILRALGESKRDIRRLFISESLIIGVLSATFATVIALLGEITVNHLLGSIASYAFVQISVSNVVTIFVMGVIISLVAAFLPARQAAKLNPIDALAAD